MKYTVVITFYNCSGTSQKRVTVTQPEEKKLLLVVLIFKVPLTLQSPSILQIQLGQTALGKSMIGIELCYSPMREDSRTHAGKGSPQGEGLIETVPGRVRNP